MRPRGRMYNALESDPFNRKLFNELDEFKHESFGDDIFLVTIGVKSALHYSS